MRRASTCLAVLGLVALGLPAVAAAEEIPTPKVSVRAKAIPIPKVGGGTWPNTGNLYGKGAAVEAEFSITGSGYGATPVNPSGGIPPISGVNFYLPAGSKINAKGFPTCTEATLKNIGPSGCPKSSAASPLGSALGEVTFGTERVPEETELRAFFAPGGGLLFFSAGHTPVSLEIISSGHYVNSHAPYGPELITQVPPVATVTGAPLASVKNIKIKAGAAIMKGGKLLSYGTIPAKGKCPKGGFPVKTEVTFGGTFGGEREFGIPAKTVTTTLKTPCPKH